MNRALQIAHLTAALAVAVFFSVSAYVVWSARSIPLHVNGVLTRAEGVESKINASAINLDKATAAWSQSAKSQADAVTGLITDAHGSLSEIDLTLASLRSNSDSLNGELAGLRKTTDAATALTTQLTTDAGTLNQSIAATQPVLEHADALLKDPAIPEILLNAKQITWNANEITFDAKRVADDATKKYFTPLPWYRKALPYVTTGAKIAAYALPW